VSIEAVYGDWRRYNELVVAAVRGMTDEELALRAGSGVVESSSHWPIWAILGHTAGARAYWLCSVLGQPGLDGTPFTDPAGDGWEDHLERPRSADELVTAWRSTWAIIEACLASWTPAALDEAAARLAGERTVHLTRRSILMRLIVHDAYHIGEVALIQGVHGRPQVDLWPPGYHTVEAAAIDRGPTPQG